MNWRDFFSDVIGSLAWPVVVLSALFMFRGPIREWMKVRPSKAKLGPLELEWPALEADVKANLKAPPERPEDAEPEDGAVSGVRYDNPNLPPSSDDTPLLDVLGPLADTAPVGAITEAHGAIERRLREVIKAQGDLAPYHGASVAVLAKKAADAGFIEHKTADSIVGLSVMHALAAQDEAAVSPKRAREYLVLADGILFLLNRPE